MIQIHGDNHHLDQITDTINSMYQVNKSYDTILSGNLHLLTNKLSTTFYYWTCVAFVGSLETV
ncbi:MAG: hypothetical protein KJO26_10345, partial [Deltaproteobacteria bacterium]|nr:hypothetical protein [Deltaproteobacteria bacterium]